MKIDRREILHKATHDCFKEMYEKAQPSADWDQIVKEFQEGKRNKNERVYEQHYLSKEEYTYIVNKYLEAYNIRPHWKDDVSVVEEYLTKGGIKDKYIPDRFDKNGDLVECGHRSHENVPPLKEHIHDILNKESVLSGIDLENITDSITNKVMELIATCKDFYRFDHEESSFMYTCALGASPTQDPEIVKKYWKEKTGEDIQIEERNPRLFWYQDEGYTDEELAFEFEDYGENWKEALDKEWKDELEKRKQEQNERLKRLTDQAQEK